VLRVLELLTLDMKVLGLGRQGHEVAGGVDSSTEAAQPSPLGGGREVRLGNRALQQVVQVLSNLIIRVCWKRRQKRGGSAALCQGTPRHQRAPQLSLYEGKALLAAQSDNMGLVLAARWTVPAAGLMKCGSRGTPDPALLHCLGHRLPAGAKLGLPLSPTWTHQRVSGPSLRKDSSVCSNPMMKPLYSVPLGKKGRHSQVQPVQAETI